MANFVSSNGDSYHSNGGNSAELAMAAQLGKLVADWLGVGTGDLFIADHDHEGLSTGSASIAWEGGDFDGGWPYAFSQTTFAETARDSGLCFEPVNTWCMAVWTEQVQHVPRLKVRPWFVDANTHTDDDESK